MPNNERDFARLSGRINGEKEAARFHRVMEILKADAKENGISLEMALYLWERAECPDLTTESGMRQYVRVYRREMSVLN